MHLVALQIGANAAEGGMSQAPANLPLQSI
jgi:hypothetical protein